MFLGYLQFGNILTIEDSIIIVIVIDIESNRYVNKKNQIDYTSLKQTTKNKRDHLSRICAS